MSTLLACVNTFLSKEHTGKIATEIELIRSTEGEKGQQIENVRGRQQSRNELAPKGEPSHGHLADADEEAPMVHAGHVIAYLQNPARERPNVFEALMEAVETGRKRGG